MGAAASIRMVYRQAMSWFKTYIDSETYITDFAQIDKDGDNSLSYVEVRKWVEEKAKKDPNWEVFLTNGAPVLSIAHKMAALRSGDKKSTVMAPKVVDVNDFKTLLIQMFAISILWSHFNAADHWEQNTEVGTGMYSPSPHPFSFCFLSIYYMYNTSSLLVSIISSLTRINLYEV